MRHLPCVQGKTDWSEYRRGIPTASAFDRIITPGGKASSQAEKYRFRLLAERMGAEIQTIKTWAMERGSNLESKAVSHYQWVTGLETEECGFIANDSMTWGGSPDRFVGEDGLLEVKCPDMETHLSYLMQEGRAYQDYKVQCQGELFICEGTRQWVDVLSYYPGLPWALARIPIDEAFQEALEKELRKFSDELEALAGAAKEKGWLKEAKKTRPPDVSQRSVVDLVRESMAEMNRSQA